MTVNIEEIADQSDWSEVYQLADTYRQQEQWQSAAIAFRRAIELRPDFFWSYHHLGDVLLQLQQWQPAVTAYSRAVRLDRQFFWSWHNLGDALAKLQQWQQAVMAYQKAVAIDPDFFWSWHNLGDALAKLQQWDRAIAVYLQGILLQPKNRRIYHKLGTVFKQRGSLEKSIQDYRQVIRSSPANGVFSSLQTKPEVLVKVADSLVDYHQILGGIVLYYIVLEITPNQTQILLRLNQLLNRYNQLQQSISQAESNHSELLTATKTNLMPQVSPRKDIPGSIAIKANASVSPQQLQDLFIAVGWSNRPATKVQQCLGGSFCHTSLWHLYQGQEQLIGFARAISDGVFHALLLDVLIHPQFQNRGLGKKLVQTIIKQLQQSDIGEISLFTSPHVMDFYHRLGFVSRPNNLQLMVWSRDS